jgi:hypothetical protein
MNPFKRLFERAPRPATRRPTPPSLRWRPKLELLDDRIVPTVSSIVSNFNGTAINAGSTVWFNSVLKVSGLGDSPVTIHVDQGTITSSAFTVNTPNADITFSPTATTATTAFDAASNTWTTIVPSKAGGNTFLDGVNFLAANGLPKGLNPVTWSINVSSNTAGVRVQWQWAAAVYTSFSSDLAALNVKPVDSNSLSQYHNSDHAGTPEAFISCVVGGARGGGGSNWTGSYSSTVSFTPGLMTPSGNGSLSGFVYFDSNQDGLREIGESGLEGIVINLTGIDANGNAVNASVATATDGSYSFAGLMAGTYELTVTMPSDFFQGPNAVGSVNGSPDGTLVGTSSIGSITLPAGAAGTEYDFAIWPPPT